MSVTKRMMGLVVASAALVGMSGVAAAARGGDSVTGTIELMGSGAEVAAVAEGRMYGEPAQFSTTLDGRMASRSSTYITVVCTQGDDVVYQYSGSRDHTFMLQDQAGQGLEWDGGDADCSATLIYRVKKGKAYDITWLDQDTFHVRGA